MGSFRIKQFVRRSYVLCHISALYSVLRYFLTKSQDLVIWMSLFRVRSWAACDYLRDFHWKIYAPIIFSYMLNHVGIKMWLQGVPKNAQNILFFYQESRFCHFRVCGPKNTPILQYYGNWKEKSCGWPVWRSVQVTHFVTTQSNILDRLAGGWKNQNQG